ncbi:serine hydrolase [Streptosporangiaceae bacterium NEAU-GS5]|nr:serine hydrolase [Streptosporangiaceae bacterium NEAU-GS5]
MSGRLFAVIVTATLLACVGCSQTPPSPAAIKSSPAPQGAVIENNGQLLSRFELSAIVLPGGKVGSGHLVNAAEREFRAKLTTKLRHYLGEKPVTVAVRDLSTGITYTYNPRLRVATASVVKVEILIGLLLKAQQAHRRLTTTEKALAIRMIEHSDNDAATALYNRVGGADGMAWTGRKLALKNTNPGPPGYWGATTTSATDQITILAALTTTKTPLTTTNRRYVLHLMSNVTPGQDWGVSAAASRHDTIALKNGWLARDADGGRWTVNSIGKVGNLLIAVLSSGNSTMTAGVHTVEHVAATVAGQIRPAPAE